MGCYQRFSARATAALTPHHSELLPEVARVRMPASLLSLHFPPFRQGVKNPQRCDVCVFVCVFQDTAQDFPKIYLTSSVFLFIRISGASARDA